MQRTSSEPSKDGERAGGLLAQSLPSCELPTSLLKLPELSRDPEWKELLADRLLVILRLEQPRLLGCITHPDPDHPARSIRIRVHERGLLVEAGIHLGDLAADRTEQLGHGFHRLDRSEHVVLLEFRADRGKLDVHDVTELALGVVGYSDLHDIAGFCADILV